MYNINKMQSSQKIKLIYDFYENDIAYDGFELETKIDNNFDYNKILLDSLYKNLWFLYKVLAK